MPKVWIRPWSMDRSFQLVETPEIFYSINIDIWILISCVLVLFAGAVRIKAFISLMTQRLRWPSSFGCATLQTEMVTAAYETGSLHPRPRVIQPWNDAHTARIASVLHGPSLLLWMLLWVPAQAKVWMKETVALALTCRRQTSLRDHRISMHLDAALIFFDISDSVAVQDSGSSCVRDLVKLLTA